MRSSIILALFLVAACNSKPTTPEPTPVAVEPAAAPAPEPMPASEPVSANTVEACEAAVTVKGTLLTSSGNGNLGADSRTAMVAECQASWTPERVACMTEATTWDQLMACESPVSVAPLGE